MKLRIGALLIVMGLLAAGPAWAQGKKTALLMANSVYPGTSLTSPARDGAALAAALKDLGFAVTFKTDLDQSAMETTLALFAVDCQGADTALFWFSGMALTDEGDSLLLPAGPVGGPGLTVNAVLGTIQAAAVPHSLILLEACASDFDGAGLTEVKTPPPGALVAFAAQPGKTAQPAGPRGGAFTRHLLKYLRTPALSANTLFLHVGNAVEKETAGTQSPWQVTNLDPLYSLYPASAGGPGLTMAPPGPTVVLTNPAAAPAAGTTAALPQPGTAEADQLKPGIRAAGSSETIPVDSRPLPAPGPGTSLMADLPLTTGTYGEEGLTVTRSGTKVILDNTGPGAIDRVWLTPRRTGDSFSIQGDFRSLAGKNKSINGLVFLEEGGTSYLLTVSNDARFAFYNFDNNFAGYRWFHLVEGQPEALLTFPSLRAGGANRLKAVVRPDSTGANRVEIWLNDYKAAVNTFALRTGGRLGIYVAAGSKIELENFLLNP